MKSDFTIWVFWVNQISLHNSRLLNQLNQTSQFPSQLLEFSMGSKYNTRLHFKSIKSIKSDLTIQIY